MVRKAYLMKCGHVAMATNTKGDPVCVTCVGINKNAEIIDNSPSDLTGRKAFCPHCKKEVPSDYNLPFFSYRGAHFKSSLWNSINSTIKTLFKKLRSEGYHGDFINYGTIPKKYLSRFIKL